MEDLNGVSGGAVVALQPEVSSQVHENRISEVDEELEVSPTKHNEPKSKSNSNSKSGKKKSIKVIHQIDQIEKRT